LPLQSGVADFKAVHDAVIHLRSALKMSFGKWII
jgi:hypothetical protein